MMGCLVLLVWAGLVGVARAGGGAGLATRVTEITYQDGDTALLPCDIRSVPSPSTSRAADDPSVSQS